MREDKIQEREGVSTSVLMLPLLSAIIVIAFVGIGQLLGYLFFLMFRIRNQRQGL